MILSKSRKFLFLRVPKTASTSLQRQILESLPYDEIDAHTSIEFLSHIAGPQDSLPEDSYALRFKPDNLADNLRRSNHHATLYDIVGSKLLNYSELNEYNIYGVMRDPIDRFVSVAQHYFKAAGKHFDPPLSNALAVSSLLSLMERRIDVDTIPRNDVLKSLYVGLPQVRWLRYNGRRINKIFKYSDISKLLQEVTGESEVKYKHRSHFRLHKQIVMPAELEQEIRKKYPEDFALWESLP